MELFRLLVELLDRPDRIAQRLTALPPELRSDLNPLKQLRRGWA
jgi:hypothetical protein